MRWRRTSKPRSVGATPVAELVRRSFRAGAFFPLVALGVIVAVGVPYRQVQLNIAESDSYSSVLEGIVSDRAAIFVDQAERVSVLLGRSDQEVPATERLIQLVALDDSIEAAVLSDRAGNIIASATDSIDQSPELVDEAALAWVSTKDAPFLSVPEYDPALRVQAMKITVPVLTLRGDLLGLLQVTVNTDWMFEAIESTNENLGVDTFLTDGNGTVLAHEDEWRVLASQRLDTVRSGLRSGLDGPSIMGASPAPMWDGHLMVVSTLPLSVVIPGAAAALLPMIFIAMAFVASRVARRNLVNSVVSPVHDLGTALQSYGPENLAVRISDSNVEEINVVAQAFNANAERMDVLVESLRASNARFKTLFEAAPVGMALQTIDGEYLDTNTVFDRMFGVPGAQMSLEKLKDMIIPESKQTVRTALRAVTRGEVDSITFEVGFEATTGDIRWAMVTATVLPQPGDHIDQVISQVVDVTELKETQSRLEELLASKNQFLAAVSHELRTPLTAVIGLAELLRDPDSDLSTEQRSELIDTIVESGFDVSNMVEDLLTAARQEAGQLTVVAVPVNVLAQTRQALEVLDTKTEVVISGEGATAVADPGRVRQILRNLLTNALKYGGDHVSVDLGSADGFARATVIDDGPGVAEDMEERIFRSYERAHGTIDHPGSVGIGLSISRELARQMGGDLQYRRINNCTHFDLTLPILDEGVRADSVHAAIAIPA